MQYNPEIAKSIPPQMKLHAARTLSDSPGAILLVGGMYPRDTVKLVVTDSEIRLGTAWKMDPKLGLIPFEQVVEVPVEKPVKAKTKIMPLGSIIPFRSKKETKK